jgi:hypothetical protein
MNLADYPTPRSDTSADSCFVGGETVDADVSRQLEREAAAWKAVAEQLATELRDLAELTNSCLLEKPTEALTAIKAFDALKSQLEKP